MKLAVIGTGAMACLFASRLSAVAEVVMVGSWPEQIAAIRRGGITVVAPGGKRKIYQVKVVSDVRNAKQVDMALILVKAYQTERAAVQVEKILSPNSSLNLALTLQNGTGNIEKLSKQLGNERVLGGITLQAAAIMEPGLVLDTGPGPVILAKDEQNTDKMLIVKDILTKAGFATEFSENIKGLIWGKIVINAAINPLTALLNVKNGYIGKHELTRRLMFRLAREATNVAAAQGISLPYDNAEKQVLMASEATAANISSMLQDVMRGSITEIDAICGEVIRKGKEYHVATPVNNIMFDLIKKIEKGELQPDPKRDLSWILAC